MWKVAITTAIVAAITIIRRKVRKEIGLWIRHSRYHPKRPPKKYFIDERIGPSPDDL